jgi:hypothetical protein
MESTVGFEPATDSCFADRRVEPLHHVDEFGARGRIRTGRHSCKKRVYSRCQFRAHEDRAGDGARTRTQRLKRTLLCRSSYAGMFGRLESNQRVDGTKLRRLTVLATPDRLRTVWAVRFELTISCFRRTQDDQLPYAHAMVAEAGIEPATPGL